MERQRAQAEGAGNSVFIKEAKESGADASAESGNPDATDQTCESTPVVYVDNTEPAQPQEQPQPAPGSLLDVRDEGIEEKNTLYKIISSSVNDCKNGFYHNAIVCCGEEKFEFRNEASKDFKDVEITTTKTPERKLAIFAYVSGSSQAKFEILFEKQGVIDMIKKLKAREGNNFLMIDNLLFYLSTEENVFCFGQKVRKLRDLEEHPPSAIYITEGFTITRLWS